MMCVLIAIAALTKAALAQGTPQYTGSTECFFTEAAETQPCSRAVGQLLIFHLSNTANIRIKKDNRYAILKTNDKREMTLHSGYTSNAELFENGTFILGNTMKNHSGDYKLDEYGSNGKLLKTINLQLEVQAPVSKPALSQVCISPEQMNISCSSRGEDPDFNVTLDGERLMQREQRQFLYGTAADIKSLKWNEIQENQHNLTTVTISLHGQLEGNLMCCVWNKVSREETVIHLSSCKVSGSDSPSSVPDVMAVRHGVGTVLLLAMCLAICIVHWKTRTTGIQEDTPQNMFCTELFRD